MNNKRLISLTVCLILVIVSWISASTLADIASETNTKAEQHFEKANELLNRKEYKAAIAEFEEVMNISPNSKIAQDAQYWMGQSHFLAGQFDAAQATFAKLIEQYPASAIVPATELMVERVGRAKDIEKKKRAIAEARMRLAALQRDIGNPELTIRRIWENSGPYNNALHWSTFGSSYGSRISPDGHYLTFANWESGNIGIYDLTTGESWDITDEGKWDDPSTGSEYGWHPIWSPDGCYVAYAWCIAHEAADHLKDNNELRIVGLDGSEPRVIYRTDRFDIEIHPYDWSPDGKAILATIVPSEKSAKDRSSHMVLISVEDGSKRILKSFEEIKWRETHMLFSPDGQYIAYDSKDASNSKIGRRICLLKTDGSGDPIPLVTHTLSADDFLFGWAPDGKGLLFSTYRTGDRIMALIEVHEGQSQGAAQFVRFIDNGFKPIGFSRNGSFHYGINKRVVDVYTATLDPETGKEVVRPVRINTSLEGPASTPCWSPDGQYLAYFSKSDTTKPLGRWWKYDTITIQSMTTREIRRIKHSARISTILGRTLRWSPDGRSFLVFARFPEPLTQNDNWGLFLIDAQTGEETLFAKNNKSTNDYCLMARWSPDGKSIFYQRGESRPAKSKLWHGASILVRDLVSGKEREIVEDTVFAVTPYMTWAGFCISPDGQRLAYLTLDNPESETPSILLKVKSVADEETADLFHFRQHVILVGWTSDGRHILYQTFASGQVSDLWRIPATGGEPRKMELTMKKGNSALRLHPDGRQVAFHVKGTTQELWVMENFLPESTVGK